MKKLILAVSLGVALGSFGDAVPVVSNASMVQPSGGREVTITYTLSDAPAVITLDIQTNATDDAWASIGGENIQNVTGDVWKKVETGAREIKWRPDISWPNHKISEGGARAVVTAWSVDNPPDYMVVNLAANATKNSETYYPAVEFLPGGLLSNYIYRTSQLVMRKIPAQGVTWEMGSRDNEIGRGGTAETMHTVTLTDNYYIAVFEMTQSQWALVQTERAWPSCYTKERDMRPVEQVSYNEIRNAANSTTADTTYDYPADPNPKSFLGLLRAKTGLLFDLPSEAQWEFACRAGHGTGYWGDGKLILSSDKDTNLAGLGRAYYNGGRVLNATGSSYSNPGTDCGVTNGTAIVGSYAPNSWGLYDMHGNVWEWCLDWYEENVTAHGGEVNVDLSSPSKSLSGAAGSTRVLRGGGWDFGANGCRAAYRNAHAPANRFSDIGFRLALPAFPAESSQME